MRRRDSVKPLLTIKAGGFCVGLSARDLVALIVLAVFLMEFALIASGKVVEAERMAIFTSGYGLGYLLERVLENVGWNKLTGSSKARRRRPRPLR